MYNKSLKLCINAPKQLIILLFIQTILWQLYWRCKMLIGRRFTLLAQPRRIFFQKTILTLNPSKKDHYFENSHVLLIISVCKIVNCSCCYSQKQILSNIDYQLKHNYMQVKNLTTKKLPHKKSIFLKQKTKNILKFVTNTLTFIVSCKISFKKNLYFAKFVQKCPI